MTDQTKIVSSATVLEPIKLRSNEYWGEQSGVIDPNKGPIFPGRRSVPKTSGNSGPTGWKLRRIGRRYANKKLNRTSRQP